MKGGAVPAMTAALAAALAICAAGAASTLPSLRSASSQRGHVVVVFSLGELGPGRIVVAHGRATRADGRLVTANLLVDEPLRLVKTATGYSARTTHTVAPGTYYVQISGTVLGMDCLKPKPCPQDWSNIRRVVVPSP